MSTKHEDAARALSPEARKVLLNAHTSGRVPNAPAELVDAGIVKGTHLTVFGEVVQYYVMEQELEGLG